MKRFFLSLAPLFLLSLSSFSQYPTFRIDYKFIVDEALLQKKNNQIDSSQLDLITAATLALALQEDDKPITQVWVNKNLVRSKTSLYNDNYEIINKSTEIKIAIYPSTKEYYKIDGFNDKLLDFGDSIKLASELHIKLVEGEEKTIAGYTCKLAKIVLKQEENNTIGINIWYNEYLPQAYWGEYAYLKKIPGAALEISTSGIGIQAYQIKPDDDVNIFKIPDDFKEIKNN